MLELLLAVTIWAVYYRAYADDIMLVCHSLTAMQRMFDICSQETDLLDFSFNTVKSVALRIGPRYKHVCAYLQPCLRYTR